MSSCRRFARVAAGLIILAVFAATNLWAENPDFTNGARKIAARIDAIVAAQDPVSAPFRNVERAAALKQIVARLEKEKPNSPEHLLAVFSLPVELLRAGEME